jgi:DsbC/DsbD-like thiol-disulfide interchange protein
MNVKILLLVLFIFFLATISTGLAFSADFFKKEDPVKIELSPAANAKAGSTIETQLELYIEQGYHLFSNKPGIKGVHPTTVEFEPSKQYQLDRIVYPKSESVYSEIFQKNLGLYQGKTVILVYLKLNNESPDKVVVKGTLKYQACSDKVCYSPKTQPFAVTQSISAK